MAYVLFNFSDTPKEADYRMHECVKLGIRPYPQQYQPLIQLNRNNKFIGRYWTKNLLRVFRYFWLMAGYFTKITFEEFAKKQDIIVDSKYKLNKEDWEKWYEGKKIVANTKSVRNRHDNDQRYTGQYSDRQKWCTMGSNIDISSQKRSQDVAIHQEFFMQQQNQSKSESQEIQTERFIRNTRSRPGEWLPEPCVGVLVDGLPTGMDRFEGRLSHKSYRKTEQVKAIGNAVISQIPELLFIRMKEILEKEL